MATLYVRCKTCGIQIPIRDQMDAAVKLGRHMRTHEPPRYIPGVIGVSKGGILLAAGTERRKES